MGAGSSVATETNAEDEISAFTAGLPMAELLNGGLIRLAGAGGYFNPDSLLEPSWLKGKLTLEEYRSAINYVNSCVGPGQGGGVDMRWIIKVPEREKQRADAGRAAVEKLNAQHRAVRFTYQQSVEKVEYIPVYHPQLISNITLLREKGRYLTTRCYIYINVN